jgi:hypothetical protein
MNVDFPIDDIKFEFECKGTGKVTVECNNTVVEKYHILSADLRQSNDIKISFTKDDPADQESFAVLKKFYINGHDHCDEFKHIKYDVDPKHHTNQKSINNNLYFGYIGSMAFVLTQKNDLLTKAAYTIADKEFEYVKWPMVQGPHYREKTLQNIIRDTKFMYMGSLAPRTPEIVDAIDSYKIKDAKLPLKVEQSRKKIEDWINSSKRVDIKNFSKMNYFNYSGGIIPSLDSFASRAERLYLPNKAYYFYRYFENNSHKLKDVFKDDIQPDSHVLFELPTLYYPNEEILEKIKEAKQKNCTIALDLTWLPISVDNIEIDLDLVDELYFSMNKTWPVDDIRPAWRWSKQKIKDASSFEMEITIYPKIPANLFMHLLEMFPFDFVYDRYEKQVESLRSQFDLEQSPVLWFTKHESVKHYDNPIFPGYYMDEFVCLRKLLDFKDKYWW